MMDQSSGRYSVVQTYIDSTIRNTMLNYSYSNNQHLELRRIDCNEKNHTQSVTNESRKDGGGPEVNGALQCNYGN